MKRTKLLMVIGVMVIAFAGLAGAAQAKKSASLNVTLDTYEPNNDGFAGPVASKVLPDHSRWVAVVQGTFSYYSPSLYVDHPARPFQVLCGTPDFTGPLFPSPDKPSNKPVGMDAEFQFARPSRRSRCQRYPLPGHWYNFQIKTAGTWSHIPDLGPGEVVPTADHTYSYPLVGYDRPAQFRLKDRPRTSDNYGELKIAIRPATNADCGDGDWKTFRFHSEERCERSLPAPAPAAPGAT
jgi:hypothetical protein